MRWRSRCSTTTQRGPRGANHQRCPIHQGVVEAVTHKGPPARSQYDPAQVHLFEGRT